MAVSEIRINLNALRHNMRVIREHLPKEVNVLAVVKANAYGHGAVQALRIALEEGYCAAAVARVEEGAELREAGFTCPIYVLGLPLAEDMPTAVHYGLIPPVDDTVDLDALEAVAAAEGKTLDVMIAVEAFIRKMCPRSGKSWRACLISISAAPSRTWPQQTIKKKTRLSPSLTASRKPFPI